MDEFTVNETAAIHISHFRGALSYDHFAAIPLMLRSVSDIKRYYPHFPLVF